jgi:co-chaperonin GroES (HSP10)
LEDAPVDRLRLLEDRILCRILTKKKQHGKIRIAGTWVYETKTQIGRVLKVGEGYDGPLQSGDYVIFAAWEGREFQSPTETLILLRPANVLAKVERGDA